MWWNHLASCDNMWNACQKLCDCGWEEQAWTLCMLKTHIDFQGSMGFLRKAESGRGYTAFSCCTFCTRSIQNIINTQDWVFSVWSVWSQLKMWYVKDKTNWSNLKALRSIPRIPFFQRNHTSLFIDLSPMDEYFCCRNVLNYTCLKLDLAEQFA